MPTGRVEAFSDSVLAIIITIMVLELKAPPEDISLRALVPLIPTFSSYVLSFVYIGIYWINHHHLFHATERVRGSVLRANLHLLFWVSLFPFVTHWIGKSDMAMVPTIAFWILQVTIIRTQATPSILDRRRGTNTKEKISLLLYITAIGLAFVSPGISNVIYILVALIWLAPDKRIERLLKQEIQKKAEGNTLKP